MPKTREKQQNLLDQQYPTFGQFVKAMLVGIAIWATVTVFLPELMK